MSLSFHARGLVQDVNVAIVEQARRAKLAHPQQAVLVMTTRDALLAPCAALPPETEVEVSGSVSLTFVNHTQVAADKAAADAAKAVPVTGGAVVDAAMAAIDKKNAK